jgi:molybdenum cofactor biosynthesis enzyme MoaA
MRNNFTFFNRKGVNIDITHRCALECIRCFRTIHYTNFKKKVPGEDMSMNDFLKVIKHFKNKFLWSIFGSRASS